MNRGLRRGVFTNATPGETKRAFREHVRQQRSGTGPPSSGRTVPLQVALNQQINYTATSSATGPSSTYSFVNPFYPGQLGAFPASVNGPSGIVQIDSLTEWAQSAGISAGNPSLQTNNINKNRRGVAANLPSFASFNNSPSFMADGATVDFTASFPLAAPDLPGGYTGLNTATKFYWGISDNPTYTTFNTGTISSSTYNSQGFVSQPIFSGSVTINARADFVSRELYRNTADGGTPSIAQHVGVFIEPFAAATQNIGILVDDATTGAAPGASSTWGIYNRRDAYTGGNTTLVGTFTTQSSAVIANTSLGTKAADFDIMDVANGTAVTLNAASINLKALNVSPTVTTQTAPGIAGTIRSIYLGTTIQGNTGATDTFANGIFTGFYSNETLKTQDTNARTLLLYSGITSNPIFSVAGSGSLTVSTLNQIAVAQTTVPANATLTALNGVSIAPPVVSSSGTCTTYTGVNVANPGASAGTFTTMVGVDIAQLTRATTNIGFRCAASVVYTPTVATVTSNAATIPVTVSHAKCTNSSAATCTITLTTANAVDGQELLVRYFDSSGVSQTVTFTNSETGKAGAPPASLGSTSIPSTYRFIFNSGTSKWTYTGN